MLKLGVWIGCEVMLHPTNYCECKCTVHVLKPYMYHSCTCMCTPIHVHIIVDFLIHVGILVQVGVSTVPIKCKV